MSTQNACSAGLVLIRGTGVRGQLRAAPTDFLSTDIVSRHCPPRTPTSGLPLTRLDDSCPCFRGPGEQVCVCWKRLHPASSCHRRSLRFHNRRQVSVPSALAGIALLEFSRLESVPVQV